MSPASRAARRFRKFHKANLSARSPAACRFEALEPRLLLSNTQPIGWDPMGIGVGGTCYWANVNPARTNEIYVETDMGEVWHTLDGGLHWTTLNMQTQIRSSAANSAVQYTSNPDTQYAVSAGATPYVTTDDGLTWTVLPGWAAVKSATGGAAHQILADPNSTSRLIVTVQKSTAVSGVTYYSWWDYYSTDGGNTLTLMNVPGGGASDTTGTDTSENFIAGAFWDGSNIYFATNKGLYTSTNGGTSWTFRSSASMSKPTNPSGFNVLTGGGNDGVSTIVSLTGSRSGSTTRLWAVTWDQSVTTIPSAGGSAWNGSYSGLYTSTDGGATWTDMDGSTFGAGNTPNLYPRWVQMADNDVADIWIGGGDGAAASPIVYKSSNTGASWTRVLQTGYDHTYFPSELPNQNVYTRAYGENGDYSWGYLGIAVTFLVNRSDPSIMTFTAMGSLYESIDGGANWFDIAAGGPNQLPLSAWNLKGTSIVKGTAYDSSQMNETSAWNFTFVDPSTIFVDDTDVACQLSTDGGATWSYPYLPGHSNPNTFYQSVYDPRTDVMYAVTSDKHDIYVNKIDDGQIEQFGSNYLVKSTDHGKTWTIMHTFPIAAPARALAVDPNDPNTVYVATVNHQYGVGGIWKTTDMQDGASSVWTYLPNQPSRDVNKDGAQEFAGKYIQQLTMLNDGTLVAVYAVRLAFAPEYLSGNGLSYTSGVWVSTDGGNSWQDRSSLDGLGDDLYLPGTGQDMYTVNGNLLTTEAYSVEIDPNDPTQNTWFATTYYFGTQNYGTIYKTTDRGQHWSVWSTVSQAMDAWIQPGGKVMLISTKQGLYYCPDYTAATPQFFNVQSMPFNNGGPTLTIASDPFNSDMIYVSTFGAGIWRANLSQITTAAAVQNVAAKTMNPTEVNVSWTIEAPVGAGYIIQKSTDQVNWSDAGAAPDWHETSYMVTGLSAGTMYYFRVLTINSAGNSAPSASAWARTDSSAGLIATEEFTQATGSLSGTGSGTGWNGNWSAGSGDTVASGNINPANPPDYTGNYASITSSGVNATRQLAGTVGSAGTVLWASFEVNTQNFATLTFGDATNGFGFGSPQYGSYAGFYTVAGGVKTYHNTSNSTVANGTNHFMVARMEFETDKVYVRLFLDPTPGLIYPNNEVTFGSGWNGASAYFLNTILPAGTNKIMLAKPSAGTAKYDEIRIGGSYSAVAPKSGIAAPSAPTGIAAAIASSNQVDLSWTNSASNQQGFTVQQSSDGGATWTTLERLYNTAGSGATIKYSITNLSAGSSYQFRVSAFNIAGSSANTSVTATTLVNPPPAIADLGVTVDSGQFVLTWSDVAGDSGYVVQYADASGLLEPFNNGELPWVTASPNAPAGSTSYTLSGLVDNTRYYFRVYPFNNGGSAFCSNVVSAISPPPVEGVAATPAADTQAMVSWTDNVSGESSFLVQASLDGVNWFDGATAPANSTQAVVAGLAPNTVYRFRVRALATGGSGAWSEVATARTFATVAGLIAYDGFNYASGAAGTAWDGQGSGTGWSGNWSVVGPSTAGIDSGSLSYSGSGVTLNTTGNSAWLYNGSDSVRTVNYTLGQDGTSLWVAYLVNQHLQGGTSPLQPNVQLGNDSNNNIRLGPWNTLYDADMMIAGHRYYMQGKTGVGPVDGQTDFLVYRLDFGQSTGPVTTPDKISLWVNPTPGVVPTDAAATTTYTLPSGVYLTFNDNSVRLNDGGYYNITKFDEVRLGTTYQSVAPVPVPARPTNLTTAKGTGGIQLTWTDASTNEQGFHVERSRDQTNWTIIQTLPAGTATWTDTAASHNITYYYRVSSFSTSGDSLYAGPASFVLTAIPGDADGSGMVDMGDYAAWFNNYGTGTTWEQGNFKGTGVTDMADYATWFNHYGNIAGSSAGTSSVLTASPSVAAATETTSVASASVDMSTAAAAADKPSAVMTTSLYKADLTAQPAGSAPTAMKESSFATWALDGHKDNHTRHRSHHHRRRPSWQPEAANQVSGADLMEPLSVWDQVVAILKTPEV